MFIGRYFNICFSGFVITGLTACTTHIFNYFHSIELLNLLSKIFEERVGCKLVPVNYMKTMSGYSDSLPDKDKKKFQDDAWDELCGFIGTQGLNDTKYKSLKENLKHEYAKGNNNQYPKSIKEIKPRIEGRTWDAVPKKKEDGANKKQ